MTAIRIAPAQVRECGVAAVTSGDDLATQGAGLASLPMPPMPPAMAAKHQAGLQAVAAQLGLAADAFGAVGVEMQVRAAAAEAADAPGGSRAAAAGSALARSVTTTVSIVTRGGVQASAKVTAGRGGVQASMAASGLRVTMPELMKDEGDVLKSRPEPARPAAARPAPPDPHEAAHDVAATAREVGSGAPVEGPPAAAVQAAVAAPVDAGAPAGGGGGSAGGAGGSDFGAGQADASTIIAGDQIDPSAPAPGELRAEQATTGVPVPAEMPSEDGAGRQDWACWMAGEAAGQGIPPTLPVMMALAQSGMRNAPAGSSDVGFFGIDPSGAYAPAGYGLARDVPPDPAWWGENPAAQLDEVVGRFRGTQGGDRTMELDDAGELSRWAADAVPTADAGQLGEAHDAATALVDECRRTGGQPAVSAGGAGGRTDALSVAKSQLGVREVGTNAGPKVDQYLASAKVGSGNPWCAGFVTWSLQQSGIEMPGTGWAAVTNWVQAASGGQHGLELVDAANARPGDLVAYDWGGDSDFGADAHMGFLESRVVDGRFTAVEGNAEDAVTRMERNVGVGRVVFIRQGA